MARPETRPFLANRPMIERKAWLLPEPLSPTTARVSPRASVKLRSETARTSDLCSSKVTSRPSTMRTLSILAVPRIKCVAQPIAQIGEAEQQRDQHGGRRQQHPGQRLDHRPACRDQRAQRRLWFLHPEPEIGKKTLGDDDLGDGERG